MIKGTSVTVSVNGETTQGDYIRPILGKKNRHRVGVIRGRWRRQHWVTVSTAKLREV